MFRRARLNRKERLLKLIASPRTIRALAVA
jgi:hypothetical protein